MCSIYQKNHWRLPPLFAAFVAALTGVLSVSAFAPWRFFWLMPLAATLLFFIWQRAETPRTAAYAGFAFGLGFFLTGVSWVFISLSTYGGMPTWLAFFGTLLFCVTLSFFPLLAALGFYYLPHQTPLKAVTAFAISVAFADWLRGTIFTGFPWLALGYSQSAESPLAGFSPILGVYGLSFLVAALGGALFYVSRYPKTVLMFFLITLGSGLGLQQVSWSKPSGEVISVALIQGNIAVDMKFRPEVFQETLTTYYDLIKKNPAKLVVLPETAMPTFFQYLPPDYLENLKNLLLGSESDLLFGVLEGDGKNYFNSAMSLGISPSQSYKKQHLVPFGEFIPAGFAGIMAMASIPFSSFQRGGAPTPLDLAGQKIAVNICYEDAFGEEIIRALPEAGFLVNLSNTAWFGDSLAQSQHLQIAAHRSAETARPTLRATNTGISAIIDEKGRVVKQLPAFTTGVLQGSVQPHLGQTPYVFYGNTAFFALLLLLLFFLFIRDDQSHDPKDC